jgi:hypothetical protein
VDASPGPSEWILQCHGAHSHTAAHVIESFEENRDPVSDWPANLPDHSTIRMLSTIWKEIVASMGPKTSEDFRTSVITVWEMVKQSTVDRLRASLSSCLQRRSENRRQSICWRLFRLDDIRFHVDAPEPWIASEDIILLM